MHFRFAHIYSFLVRRPSETDIWFVDRAFRFLTHFAALDIFLQGASFRGVGSALDWSLDLTHRERESRVSQQIGLPVEYFEWASGMIGDMK